MAGPDHTLSAWEGLSEAPMQAHLVPLDTLLPAPRLRLLYSRTARTLIPGLVRRS